MWGKIVTGIISCNVSRSTGSAEIVTLFGETPGPNAAALALGVKNGSVLLEQDLTPILWAAESGLRGAEAWCAETAGAESVPMWSGTLSCF